MKAGVDPDRAGAEDLDNLSTMPQLIKQSAARFRGHIAKGNLEQVLTELDQKQTVGSFKSTMDRIEKARPSLALQIFNHVASETLSLRRKTIEEFKESPWKLAGTVAVTVLAPEFRLPDIIK